MKIYKDSSKSIQERIQDLLKRMTPSEKMAQMACVLPHTFFSKYREAFMDGYLENGIGSISWLNSLTSNHTEENVRILNEIQTYLINHTRLGIPAIFHGEAIAGALVDGAVSLET